MSDIIERVAAVIAAEIMQLTAKQRRGFKFPDDANGDTIDRARCAARAVIAVMREPTRHMVEAGDAFQTTLACWRIMIDEVLR